jgi:hypothetical protein
MKPTKNSFKDRIRIRRRIGGADEMLAKNEVIDIVEALPENIAFDEIVSTLAVIGSDRRATDDIRCGRVRNTERMLESLLLPEA